MAGLQNDTPKLRAWLASRLKLEDVPEEVWSLLVEDRYVQEALDPDLPDGRKNLLARAQTSEGLSPRAECPKGEQEAKYRKTPTSPRH